jgi:hypothetical protein
MPTGGALAGHQSDRGQRRLDAHAPCAPVSVIPGAHPRTVAHASGGIGEQNPPVDI